MNGDIVYCNLQRRKGAGPQTHHNLRHANVGGGGEGCQKRWTLAEFGMGVGESTRWRALDDQRGREKNSLVASTSLKRVAVLWLVGRAWGRSVLGPENLR